MNTSSPLSNLFFTKYHVYGAELLTLYLKENTFSLEQLDVKINDFDFEGVRRWAHRIKGSSRAIYASRIELIAEQIEEESLMGNQDFLKRKYNELEKNYKELIKYVEIMNMISGN